ncbi:MAG: amino acid-binding protein [Lachnospiraceae bacterium]
MTIKQLSVFLENREGRLDEVLETLGRQNVNIVALSLADTSDYGMLRMIVSDPQKGKEVLKAVGITAMITEVIALRVSHASGSLSKAMHQLVVAGVNVEYMYAFANGKDASAVLKTEDSEKAIDVLLKNGFNVWKEEEAYTANC